MDVFKTLLEDNIYLIGAICIAVGLFEVSLSAS